MAVLLLPAGYKRYAAYLGGGVMLTAYPAALSRSFKPKLVPVYLYVDQTGIYVDNAPLARRERHHTGVHQARCRQERAPLLGVGTDRQAVRTASTSRRRRTPLTLEMKTRSGQSKTSIQAVKDLPAKS